MYGFTQNQGIIVAVPDTYNFVVKNCPFIFEGEVISVKPFYSETLFHGKNNSPYSSNIIKINKIFRGNPQLKEGTVEIITYSFDKREPIMMEGKIVGYDRNPNLSFAVGSKGIFFCFMLDGNNPTLSPTNSTTDNIIRLKPSAPYYDVEYINLESNYGLLRNFGSKEKVYEYLSRFDNITIPKEEEKK